MTTKVRQYDDVNRQDIDRRATRFWQEIVQNVNKCPPFITKVL